MSTTTTNTATQTSYFSVNCVACRKGHRRCSRELPSCDECQKRSIECVYKPRKKREISSGTGSEERVVNGRLLVTPSTTFDEIDDSEAKIEVIFCHSVRAFVLLRLSQKRRDSVGCILKSSGREINAYLTKCEFVEDISELSDDVLVKEATESFTKAKEAVLHPNMYQQIAANALLARSCALLSFFNQFSMSDNYVTESKLFFNASKVFRKLNKSIADFDMNNVYGTHLKVLESCQQQLLSLMLDINLLSIILLLNEEPSQKKLEKITESVCQVNRNRAKLGRGLLVPEAICERLLETIKTQKGVQRIQSTFNIACTMVGMFSTASNEAEMEYKEIRNHSKIVIYYMVYYMTLLQDEDLSKSTQSVKQIQLYCISSITPILDTMINDLSLFNCVLTPIALRLSEGAVQLSSELIPMAASDVNAKQLDSLVQSMRVFCRFFQSVGHACDKQWSLQEKIIKMETVISIACSAINSSLLALITDSSLQ